MSFEKEADAIGAREEAEEAQARGELGVLLERLAKARPRAKRTSSKKGVSWQTHSRKWTASISFAGSQRYLGIFEKEVDQGYS